jgi:hypothetical protein
MLLNLWNQLTIDEKLSNFTTPEGVDTPITERAVQAIIDGRNANRKHKDDPSPGPADDGNPKKRLAPPSFTASNHLATT